MLITDGMKDSHIRQNKTPKQTRRAFCYQAPFLILCVRACIWSVTGETPVSQIMETTGFTPKDSANDTLSCFLRSGDWGRPLKVTVSGISQSIVSSNLVLTYCFHHTNRMWCKEFGFFSWLCQIGDSWTKTFSQNLERKQLAWVGLVTNFINNYLWCGWLCGFGLVNIKAQTV